MSDNFLIDEPAKPRNSDNFLKPVQDSPFVAEEQFTQRYNPQEITEFVFEIFHTLLNNQLFVGGKT